MRKPFNPLPVGSSMINASLPGTEQINGIIVDNPSGQWLFITPLYEYVPPYTMGWSRNLSGGVTQVSVVPGNGPAGQVSTIAGDPVDIILDSEQVGVSQGATNNDPFIERFTPTLVVSMDDVAIPFLGLGFGVNLPAVVGKRHRLLLLVVTQMRRSGSAGDDSQGFTWQLSNTGLATSFLTAITTPETPTVAMVLGGIDMPVNSQTWLNVFPTYADGFGSAMLTYQEI